MKRRSFFAFVYWLNYISGFCLCFSIYSTS